MKSGDAVLATPRGHPHRAAPRPHARVLRLRGGGGRPQRAEPDPARAPRLAARRPRDSGRADQRAVWRPAARERCAPRSRRAGGVPIRHGHGTAVTRCTPRPRCSSASNAYTAREVDIDGCVYREGLQAVRIDGGVAMNVVPDECVVTVNFRFAPDRDGAAAEAHVREVFDGFELAVTDLAPGALPGLTRAGCRRVHRGRPAPRRRPSSAGPTCRASPRSASPR